MKAQYCFSCMNELAGQVASCPYCHASLPYRIKDPNDLPAGMVLKKRYLVGRSLGRGGFGATYIARDLKKDKILTIKEYFPEFACLRNPGSNFVAFKPGTEDKFLSYQKEFRAEAQHLKMLRDIPGVVQYCDFFEAFGTCYLVMTYLEGKTLKDIQLEQHRPFSLQEGVDYTLRTLQVLSRVHGKKILHRDISPDNIFMTVNGQINLIDFGSSSLLSQANMTGFTKGVYTAPEQRINGTQGPATDLYAVGVTLFTLLVNHKPKEAEGIHLEEMPEAIPQGIRAVYEKAIQREMSQRYQSADEMARALSQASGVPLPPAPSNRKKKLRNLLLAMMALVVVLMAVMAMAFSGGTPDEAEATPTPVPATATPVVTDAPTATPVPVLPADSWLCRMQNQLYRISPMGTEIVADGTFPVEESQLQPVEVQGLESYQLIYGLDQMQIVYLATGQCLTLSDAGDSAALWLQPGEYALRVSRDDHVLAETFNVPALAPVRLSASGEEILESWWTAEAASTVTAAPAIPHEHEWQEWVIKEATCVARGELARECLICGEAGETKAIPPLGHDMQDATCTDPALCVRCGAKDTAHQPALGHAWQAATCTEPKVCARCNETEGDAAGHQWDSASCTEPGTCKVCGAKSGDSKNHAWGTWHGNTATCSKGGTEERICGECGTRENRDTKALGHMPGEEATCTTAQTCTRCGEVLKAAKGHDRQSATCTQPAICKVCGLEEKERFPALGHYASTEATCTTAQTCKRCGVTLQDKLGHAPGAAATCTTAQKCTRCGATLKSALGHVPGAEATCTTAQKCTRCGDTLKAAKGHDRQSATCTEPAYCKVCGVVEADRFPALGHYAGAEATCTTAQTCKRCGVVLKEALGHAPAANVICTAPQKCTRCGVTLKETQGHAPGTEATCTTAQKCTRCMAILEHALGHSWGNWHGNTATCSAGGTEERICGNCGARDTRATDPLAHAYGAWKLVQEATCISPQASRRFCGTCGAVEWHYDDGIGAKKHSYVDGVCVWCQMSEPDVSGSETCEHQWEKKNVKAATCTGKGAWIQICTLCSKKGQELIEIPALGHDMMAATCTAPASCRVCGAEDSSHHPALGHAPGRAATCTSNQRCTRCNIELMGALGHKAGTEPTCTTAQKCTRCGDTLKAALGHAPGVAATCTTAQKCTRCSTTLKDKLGHAPGAAATCTTAQTCTRCGTTLKDKLDHAPGDGPTCTSAQKCTRCSTTLKDKLGHAPGAAATCTTAQTCTRCGTTLKEATSHSYGNWGDNTATCIAGGAETRSCSSCGKIDSRDTAALGHSYDGVWTRTESATCQHGIKREHTCTRCNYTVWYYDDKTVDHSYVNGKCKWCGKAY